MGESRKGSRISINLEVKNRRSTAASKPMKKGARLLGDQPEKPFCLSKDDEINVLSITGYHAGAISTADEMQLAQSYLDDTQAGKVIDSVALCVVGQGSLKRLYFPTNCPLYKK
jgi:hypothetical protein